MTVRTNVQPTFNHSGILLPRIAWLGAHAMLGIAGSFALFLSWKAYQHNNHLIVPISLLLLTVLPWFVARRVLRSLRKMNNPTVDQVLQRDVTYQLGVLVMLAYALFIGGVACALIGIKRFSG